MSSETPYSILLALLEIFTALLQALLCATKSTIIDLQVINLLLCGEDTAVATVFLALLLFASTIITAILFASCFP